MNAKNKQIRIAVTGPESTGKTTLAKQLAEHYRGQYIPEYAREYIENLQNPYTFADIEVLQISKLNNIRRQNRVLIIFLCSIPG